MTKWFNKSAKVAGFILPINRTFYALRDLFATNTAFSEYAHMTTYKSVMGYKDMKTLELYYREDYRYTVNQEFSFL